MTRKDHKAMAKAMRVIRPALGDTISDRLAQWQADVTMIASVFHTDDSHFNEDRFRKSCGCTEHLAPA